jgi:hypothetical protein
MQLHLINTEENKFAKFEGMDVLTFYFDLSFFLSLSKGKMVEVWQYLEWRIFIMTINCIKGVDDKFDAIVKDSQQR